jgi:hypothetical protein
VAMSAYNAIPSAGDDLAQFAAVARAKRLNKSERNWVLGLVLDVVFGVLPWVVGSALVATALTAVYTNVDDAPETFALFNAPVALGAISTFASFLLVSKQAANWSKNSTIIGEFGNLSGSLVNLCLFVKSQISSGKSIEFLTLPDGQSGFYQATRIGLACSSVMYIIKFNGRGTTIIPAGLPLGQDARLLNSYVKYTSPANGAPGMSPFIACMLIISELTDEFTLGEKPSEYAVLFGVRRAPMPRVLHAHANPTPHGSVLCIRSKSTPSPPPRARSAVLLATRALCSASGSFSLSTRCTSSFSW